MATARAYAGYTYLLKLDGVDAGFAQSFEGGHITAEVINEKLGPSYIVKKHIGPPRYEPFTLGLSLSMGAPLKDWIQASLSMNYQRKNGSIIVANYAFKAVKEIEFFNALITEVGFPAADGSSKDAAYLTVKIQPEMTRTTKPSGNISSKLNTKQKQALVSNFRLAIDGLDCAKVIKVNGFTVKQTHARDAIGDARDYMKEPASMEVPNLAVTFASVAAQSWEDWFDSFVIKGHNDEGQEKSGSLAFLSPNMKDELLTIELLNLGIFSLKTEKVEANADSVQRMTAELYCEQMALKLGK